LGLCLHIFFFLLSHLPPALRALPHPPQRRCLCFHPAQDLAAVMSNWMHSNVSREQLLCLVEAGQLPPLTDPVEWRVPCDESVSRPPRGMWCYSWPSMSAASPSPPAGSSAGCYSRMGCNSSTSTRTTSNRRLHSRRCTRCTSASVPTSTSSSTSSGSLA
jgi:hypothetical protein